MEFSSRIAWLVGLLPLTQNCNADRDRWHILTGIGAYVYIVMAEVLTSRDGRTTPSEAYAWPVSVFLGSDGEQLVGATKRY